LAINTYILKFSRLTSGQKLVPEIDGLRFFAIITVLIFHLNTAFSRAIGSSGAMGEGTDNPLELGWWIIRMDLGVKVFFAISGFILALPFIKSQWFGSEKVNIGRYLLRRLTRLEPPYIISLSLFFAVHVVVLGASAEEYLPNFLASIVYVHNFVFDRSSIILPVAWSLEVEVQFYLLIPLFAALFFKPTRKFWSFILVAIFALLAIFSKHYIMRNDVAYIGSSILVYFSHFAVGILFAMFYLLNKTSIQTKGYVWDIVGLAAMFSLFYFYKPQVDIGNNLVFNTAIFALFMSVFKGRITNAVYRWPIIFVIGGMCYTIYLIHFPVYMLLVKGSKGLAFEGPYYANLAIQFAVLIPIVIGLSAVYFKLFEQPFMDKNWPANFKKWVSSKTGR
jgi:peptidoglycan/LPS O-acetylase OafA/YrhL